MKSENHLTSEEWSKAINMVYSIANKYGIYRDELVSIGLLELVKASKRWDRKRGKFTTYSRKWVRYGIFRYFKSNHSPGIISLDKISCAVEPKIDPLNDNIKELMNPLNEIERQIIQYRWLEERTWKECIRLIGKPVKELKNIETNALNKMRSYEVK